MTIIEIQPLDNGAHNNQTTSGVIPVPDGWAILPDSIDTPNFPFGDITVDDSTPPVVTSWTAGEIPEEPEPEPIPSTADRIETLEAENTVLKAQMQALSDSNEFLEDCIAEMATVVYA